MRVILGTVIWCMACGSIQALENNPFADEYPEEEDVQYCSELFPGGFEDEPEDSGFSFLDEHQKTFSEYMGRFINSVDSYLSNTVPLDESTGTYLQITLETIWSEGGRVSTDPGLSFKVRLPKTQRKLKLIFESDPSEKRDTEDRETRTQAVVTEEKRDTSYYAGVEAELRKERNWKVRPSIGVRIRSPLDWYVRLRATREVKYEKWRLYLSETAYWFDSTGTGFDSLMDWDRPLTDNLLFRSTSFARWTNETDYIEMSQSLNLIHRLSKNRSVVYKAAVFGNSEPTTHATSYLLNLRYRQNIHSDYLFMDIQPQIFFNKTRSFEAEHSLLFRLEWFYRD